jgi:hypothetical protein
MTRILDYLHRNTLAAIALLFALLSLGGASYAAFSLPAGSVGSAQLRSGAVTSGKLANGSITPAKLDSRTLGGSIRHWAHVRQDGHLLGGSRGARAMSLGSNEYSVRWGSRFSAQCAAMVTPAGVPGIAPIATSTGVGIVEPPGKATSKVFVWTYGTNGPIQAPFDVAVVC